eukprot:4551329-Pleurochrysis_carterae.AAC.1
MGVGVGMSRRRRRHGHCRRRWRRGWRGRGRGDGHGSKLRSRRESTTVILKAAGDHLKSKALNLCDDCSHAVPCGSPECATQIREMVHAQ